jgi:hypothetical protein
LTGNNSSGITAASVTPATKNYSNTSIDEIIPKELRGLNKEMIETRYH